MVSQEQRQKFYRENTELCEHLDYEVNKMIDGQTKFSILSDMVDLYEPEIVWRLQKIEEFYRWRPAGTGNRSQSSAESELEMFKE